MQLPILEFDFIWVSERKIYVSIELTELVYHSLPLNAPEQPGFGREKFIHSIKTLVPGIAYDDNYQLNTQSGTQWDGFRHVCVSLSTKWTHFPQVPWANIGIVCSLLISQPKHFTTG